MRNIKIILEYDGSRYDSWQKPAAGAKGMTIQERLESVLEKMDNEKIEVIGAARTEAGVHARGQVANFHTNTDMSCLEIKRYLNRFLPRDIAVLEAVEVPDRFHAAFLAKAFAYEYRISIGEVPSVFDRKYNFYCFKRPDIRKMKEAAGYFIGEHDFSAFSENKRMKKSTVRKIFDFQVYGSDTEIRLTVKGDDFWPGMVRIMAGTVLAAGKKEIAPAKVKQIIESGNRELAGERLEAKGLFLNQVFYERSE